MRLRYLLLSLALLLVLTSCKKKEAPVAASAPAAPAATNTATAAPSTQDQPSLVSLGAGAVVVQKPQEEGDAYGAFRLIDEAPDRGWSTPDGVVSPQTMTFALSGKWDIDRVEFDTEGLKPGRAAKDVVVEVSDSAAGQYITIAHAALDENRNHQSFPVTTHASGKFVRLTVQNNHGDKDNIELLEFRAFGKQVAPPELVKISGDYTSNLGDMQLRQNGASVAGCYGTGGGKINGGIDGRTLKFTWSESSGDAGAAVVNFSDDAKEFFGLYWKSGETGGGNVWSGSKAAGTFAGCGLTQNSAQEQLAGELEKQGRTRVYGINFDVDSATIKPESKATLEEIIAVLKSKPEWKLTIEGHTDSTGNDAHNQQLSEQRAASVKTHLVNGGIADARLTPRGFGATKPVAANDTEIGRAQNRRVELVKE